MEGFRKMFSSMKNATKNKLFLYILSEKNRDKYLQDEDYYYVGTDTTDKKIVLDPSDNIHNSTLDTSRRIPRRYILRKRKVLSYQIAAYIENIGYFISLLYLMRLYDYFAKSKRLTLQKNNLASFCVSLVVTNVLTIVDLFYQIPNFLVIITCTEITTTVLLLTMAMDTCVHLTRNRSRRRPRTDSQHGKFLVHTVFGWIIAQAVGYLLVHINKYSILIFIDIKLLLHILILILFFVSVYNIKPYPAGVHDMRVLQNFSIFGRTLIITFVFSFVRCLYAIIYYFAGKNQNFEQAFDLINAYSGVFVYYSINYRKSCKAKHVAASPTSFVAG